MVIQRQDNPLVTRMDADPMLALLKSVERDIDTASSFEEAKGLMVARLRIEFQLAYEYGSVFLDRERE